MFKVLRYSHSHQKNCFAVDVLCSQSTKNFGLNEHLIDKKNKQVEAEQEREEG